MSDTVIERTAAPTMFEWHASMLVGAAKNVAAWIKTTNEAKIDWKPEDTCRTIAEQVKEMVGVNRGMGAILAGREKGDETEVDYGNRETAATELIASAKELAEVVRGLSADVLEKEFPIWGITLKGKQLITVALGNMYYHGGQINYVQLMDGDTEFHFAED